jgi:hypothetical protein
MVDRLDADVGVAGGSEQLQLVVEEGQTKKGRRDFTRARLLLQLA